MNKKITYIILIGLLMMIITGLIEVMKMGIKNRNFIFKTNYELIKEEVYDISDIEHIKLNLKTADIQFYLSDDKQLKIVQKGSKKSLSYHENIMDRTIEITETIEKSFALFDFLTHSKYEVYLPKEYVNNLTTSTASGDINFKKGEINIQNLEISTVSGNMTLESEFNFNSLSLNTISGDIKANYLFGKDITVKSTSGDIDLSEAHGEIVAETVSGDSKLTNLMILGNSKIGSVSGDVVIYMNKENNCFIETNSVSGEKDISQSIYGLKKFELVINTISGDIKVE